MTPKVKPPASDDRPHGTWVIYPFWLLLFLRGDFLLSTVGVLLGLTVIAYLYVVVFPGQLLLTVAAMAGLIVWYVWRWAGIFLIRMIVDYDAAGGNGMVTWQRLVPHPTEPEIVQLPLQQAAEGSPEVNTKGLLNTWILQFKFLKFLRPFTVGDLTLRGPSAPFGIRMYGIQDPGGVRGRLASDWKKIKAINDRKKAEADRREDIERMTVAVTQGIIAASRAGMVDLKASGAPLEFKPDTPLAKAEKEVSQQIAPPPPPVIPSPPPPDPGVSELRPGFGPDGKPLAKPEDEEPAPTESTGIGEDPDEPEETAPGALPRGAPRSR